MHIQIIRPRRAPVQFGKLALSALAAILLVLVAGAPASHGDLRQDLSPRALAQFNPKWAKHLTLADLNVQELNRTTEAGVEIVAVKYHAFDQPFANADGGVTTLPWRQRALLFLPPQNEPATKVHQAILQNFHDGLNLNHRGMRLTGVAMCQAFGIPVLLHGWEPDVMKALDGQSYHNSQVILFKRLLDARIERAEDMPLDGRYLVNGLPLTKGDMVSITLLQRLAEKERGYDIKEVGSFGFSKEGWAHWILGAVDDRVAVLGTGGHYLESFRDTLERYRLDWNGEYPPELKHKDLLTTLWRLGDWLTNTEAGRFVDRASGSPEHWSHLIHARHVLVAGDFGQHDRPFPVLAENRFFKSFPHPSWQYVRLFAGPGVDPAKYMRGAVSLRVLPHVADALLFDSKTPTTPAVTVEEQERRIQVTANSTLSGDLKTEALLAYMISPERTLRRDRSSWTLEPMTPGQATGEFKSPLLPAVPDDHSITYMVIVRELVERPPIRYWRTASSLPQEHFPLPEHDGTMPRWRDG